MVECNCKRRCQITPERRQTIFNEFHQIDAINQGTYLLSLIKLHTVARRRNGKYSDPADSRRQTTVIYTVPDENGQLVNVCRSVFEATFVISHKKVQTLIMKKKQGATVFENRRRCKKALENDLEINATECDSIKTGHSLAEGAGNEVNKQYSATDLEAFMKIAANWQNSNNLLESVDIKSEMQQYMNSPAMNMYKKRERTQNWNHQEKKFLLDLCRKDMRIIENKRLDAGLTAVKNKAWKIIHQKFSNQFGTDRTCNRLKEQWRRMKACTRNEILDYNNRLTRFGAEMADHKKPSPFTFEVWDFMQEAKKACKSEALDGIDYSKIPLALEEDYEYREDEHNPDEEHDMDDSRTPPQELCDIDIKAETNETFNDTYNDSLANGDRLSVSPNQSRIGASLHDADRSSLHSPANTTIAEPNGFLQQNGELAVFQPTFDMNNISATLEALNALRTGQFPSAAAAAAAALQNNFAAAAQQHQQQQQQHQQSQNDDQPPPVKRARSSSTSMASVSDNLHLEGPTVTVNGAATTASSSDSSSTELRAFMDMQSKEHLMRMKILEVQLQAAKYSRDLVEINKTLALQKLREYASKRM